MAVRVAKVSVPTKFSNWSKDLGRFHLMFFLRHDLWWKSSTRRVALSCTMYMDGADCRATNELCCAGSVEAQAVSFPP